MPRLSPPSPVGLSEVPLSDQVNTNPDKLLQVGKAVSCLPTIIRYLSQRRMALRLSNLL